MRKYLLFEFIKSYCNKPVEELRDPNGDSSGDEMYNSDTKHMYENELFRIVTLHSCFKDSGCFRSNICECCKL